MSRPTLGTIASTLGLVALGVFIGLQISGRDSRTTPTAETAVHSLVAGPFRVQISIAPEMPVVGDNTVVLRVFDANGDPVTDATIRVVAVMPAMSPMPEMRALAEIVEVGPGRYEGRFNLSMDGSWPLTVEIEKAGLGTARLSFDMATRRPGIELISGAQSQRDQSDIDDAPLGTVYVDARRRQLIGLRLGSAETMPLQRELRAVGRVTYDETRLSDVTLRFDAWVGELTADHVGAEVFAGQTLMTVYGPDLLAAQQGYLEVLGRRGSGPLVDAARRNLELWNVSDTEIAALERRGTPLDYVPILAPQSGIVIEKNVVEGSSSRAGARLMRIADISEVWVEAEVYEADLAMVSQGMPALVTLPYLPGESFAGAIDYIYPYLDPDTRTTRVRLSLENPGGRLKPDMYAEMVLSADYGPRLVVPVEAVIFAGNTRVVFEDLGDGRLAPRRIRTGLRNDTHIEVLEGLAPGARIVTSGNFLIASESRLSSGLDQW